MTFFDNARDDARFDLVGMLRRDIKLFAIIILGLLTVTIAVVYNVRPLYRAEARILVDPRQMQVATFESVVSNVKPDLAMIRSEIDSIASPATTLQVINRLNLRTDPRMAQDSRFSNLQWIGQMLPGAAPTKGAGAGSLAERKLVETLLGNLSIENDGLSYVMRVTYRSTYPDLAAAIVDGYAQVFRDQQLEQRAAAARQATAWLDQQAAELKIEVRQSDEAIQQFIQANNLGQAKGSTLVGQQLAEVNSELVQASDQRLHKEAELAQLRGKGSGADGAAVLSSPVIQRLREQEADLQRHQAEMDQQYQPNHVPMQTLAAGIASMREKINVETKRVIDSVEGQVRELAAREAGLRAQVHQLTAHLDEADRANVRLKELERTAEANRTLYQSLLTRSKQTFAEEQLRRADSRILSSAYVESKEQFPAKPALYALAIGASLALSLLVVVVLEALRRGYRSEGELEADSGWPAIGGLPRVEKGLEPVELVVRQPNGVYSDAIDLVVKSLLKSGPAGKGSVVLVTSSVPKEGKSVLAASLARFVASMGRTAILVDCDLRRPSVAKLFKMAPNAVGCSPLLSGDIDASPLFRDPDSGLVIAPASPTTALRTAFAPENLSRLIETLRNRFDFVILDAPPVLPVADALALGPLVDVTLFAVRWETTPRRFVRNAIRALTMSGAVNPHAVLTQVDIATQAAYRSGERTECYGRYAEYYTPAKPAHTQQARPVGG